MAEDVSKRPNKPKVVKVGYGYGSKPPWLTYQEGQASWRTKVPRVDQPQISSCFIYIYIPYIPYIYSIHDILLSHGLLMSPGRGVSRDRADDGPHTTVQRTNGQIHGWT